MLKEAFRGFRFTPKAAPPTALGAEVKIAQMVTLGTEKRAMRALGSALGRMFSKGPPAVSRPGIKLPLLMGAPPAPPRVSPSPLPPPANAGAGELSRYLAATGRSPSKAELILNAPIRPATVAATSGTPIPLDYPAARPAPNPVNISQAQNIPMARALNYPVAQPHVSIADRVAAAIANHPKKTLGGAAAAAGGALYAANRADNSPRTPRTPDKPLPPHAANIDASRALAPRAPAGPPVPGTQTFQQFADAAAQYLGDSETTFGDLPTTVQQRLGGLPARHVLDAFARSGADLLRADGSPSDALRAYRLVGRLGDIADDRASRWQPYNEQLSRLPPEEQAAILDPARSHQGFVQEGIFHGYPPESLRDPATLARALSSLNEGTPLLPFDDLMAITGEHAAMQAGARHFEPAQLQQYQQLPRAARLQLARALENRELNAQQMYPPRLDIPGLMRQAAAGGTHPQQVYDATVATMNPDFNWLNLPQLLRNKTPWQPAATGPVEAWQRSLASRGIGDPLPGAIPVGGFAHPGPDIRHSWEAMLAGPQNGAYDEATGQYAPRTGPLPWEIGPQRPLSPMGSPPR